MAAKLSHFESVDAMVAKLTPGYPVYCLRPQELERTGVIVILCLDLGLTSRETADTIRFVKKSCTC